jgi:hypothetical protein
VLEVVGVQMCGFPRFDQERREGERRKAWYSASAMVGMAGLFS